MPIVGCVHCLKENWLRQQDDEVNHRLALHIGPRVGGQAHLSGVRDISFHFGLETGVNRRASGCSVVSCSVVRSQDALAVSVTSAFVKSL